MIDIVFVGNATNQYTLPVRTLMTNSFKRVVVVTKTRETRLFPQKTRR
jgi:hypothetical protein